MPNKQIKKDIIFFWRLRMYFTTAIINLITVSL